MLTPQEIQEKKFEKAVFGGYDMGQIDRFLDEVLNDYSALYKENAALKAKMRVLVDKIDEYRSVDEEMRKTLFTAQRTARETVEKARREADEMKANAEAEVLRQVSGLQEQVHAEERRLDQAKSTCAEYASKIKSLLMKNIEVMDAIMDRPAPEVQKPVEEPVAAAVSAAVEAPAAEGPAMAEQAAAEPETVQNTAESGETQHFELDIGGSVEQTEELQNAEHAAYLYESGEATPKPKFNFSDLRFGKGYKEES